MYPDSDRQPIQPPAPIPDLITLRRWPTERLLFYLNALVAVTLWASFARLSPQMLGWVLLFISMYAWMNLAFVAHIRGSAVRLSPSQFPELHARVEELARRMGLRRMPEVYLSQQDGAINAFATRFLRSHFVVLLSDLLEACGDNLAARDMIIGHELGHIRAGHLRGHWLLMPAMFVPFLGTALSRAREYTCDRYGRAAAGSDEAATLGLTILAAGGKYASLVDRAALASQHQVMQRGWMLVGQWMSTHPPLSKRLIALVPALAAEEAPRVSAPLRWLRPAFAAAFVVLVGMTSVAMWMPRFRASAERKVVDPAVARAKVDEDLRALQSMIQADLKAGLPVPWDYEELYHRWYQVHAGKEAPVDPFSGYGYDYDQRGGAYRIWSLGPDAENRTADDIVLDSRNARLVVPKSQAGR
jgi:Zn-dependent protease with chaperone function